MLIGPSLMKILLIASIPVGMVCCFLGYRTFRFVLGVLGFLGGMILGNIVSMAVFNFEGILFWVFIIAVGVLGAGLSIGLYFFGIFVAGAVIGGLAGSFFSPAVSVEPVIGSLVLGTLCGILALLIQKAVIVVSTSLLGAGMAIWGGMLLLGGPDAAAFFQDPVRTIGIVENREILLVGWLVLAGFGMLVQFRSRSRHPDSGKNKDD